MPTTRLTRTEKATMSTPDMTRILTVETPVGRMRHDPLIRRWMERARYERDWAIRETHPEVKRMLRDDARFAVRAVRIRFRRLMREVRSLRAGYIDVLAHEPARCTCDFARSGAHARWCPACPTREWM